MKLIFASLTILLLPSFLYAQGPDKEPPSLIPKSQFYYHTYTSLRDGDRDLVQWAVELADKEPEDIHSALVKIDIMLRMGLDKRAAKTVVRLRSLCPELNQDATTKALQSSTDGLIHGMVGNIYAKSWETALAVADNFPEWINDLPIEDTLLKDFRQKGWNDDRIDRWLAAKVQYVSKHPWPYGPRPHNPRWGISRPNGPARDFRFLGENYFITVRKDRPKLFWLKLRLRHLKSLGREAEVLAPLEKDVKTHPSDAQKMLDYLNLLSAIYEKSKEPSPDLAWVAKTFQPRNSTTAFFVAEWLMRLKQWTPAEKLLQYAIDTPLQESEMFQPKRLVTPGMAPHYYSYHLKRCLSTCQANLHKPQPSTKVPSKPAPSKETEKQILAREKAGGKYAQYWESRSRFYLDRKRFGKAEESYRKGLELLPREREVGKPSGYPRSSLFSSYVRFLEEQKRFEDVFDLLHKELQAKPAYSDSVAVAAFHIVGPAYREYLSPTDPVLWDWLASVSVSCYEEERVLDALVARAKESAEKRQKLNTTQANLPPIKPSKPGSVPPEIHQLLQQFEKRAQTAHPSFVLYYVRLLLLIPDRLGIPPDPDRAIHWLRYTLKRTDLQGYIRGGMVMRLFDAYVQAGDYRNAKEMLDEVLDPKKKSLRDHYGLFIESQGKRCHLGDIEFRKWLSQLAVLAAKQGDRKAAMQYWRQMANWSFSDEPYYDLTRRLRNLGLKDQIDAYYREVQKKLPEFVIPK